MKRKSNRKPSASASLVLLKRQIHQSHPGQSETVGSEQRAALRPLCWLAFATFPVQTYADSLHCPPALQMSSILSLLGRFFPESQNVLHLSKARPLPA